MAHMIGVHVPVRACICSWLQGQRARLKKAILEIVILPATRNFTP